MSRQGKTFSTVLAVGLAALALLGVLAVADAVRDRPPERIAGEDRIATAAAIAARAFPDGAQTVYLARADAASDALAAGALTDGPVALVPQCGQVPGPVGELVERLDPDEVIALGGEQAVCEDLLLAAGAARDVDRIAGASRVTTATAIARRAFPDGSDSAYLVDRDDAPDAVAAGSLSDGPLLPVPTDGPVPGAVSNALERLTPERVVALGGPAAVSDSVLRDAAEGRSRDRIAGQDRYGTAAAIALASADDDPPDVCYLARGDVFADAIAASTLNDGPVLLVAAEPPLPASVADALASLGCGHVTALGGSEAVSDAVRREALRYTEQG